MNILQGNLLLLFIYSILLVFKKKKFNKVFLFLITVQLILINGLRSMWIGIDTNRYYRYFHEVRSFKTISSLFDYNMESGYTFYQKLVGLLTDNFQIFLLITASIIYVTLAFFVYKYSGNYFFSYLFFITFEFFAFSLSGIRQSIAISLGLIAFHFAIQKKLPFFIMIVLLATSFHTSALALIIFYPLANFRLKKNHLIFLTILYTVVVVFRYQIGALLTIFYYDDRSSSMLQQYDLSNGLGGTTLLILFILIIGVIFQNVLNNDDIVLQASFNIILVSLFFQTLSSFSYLFTRLNMYFLIILIIFIPKLFEPIKSGKSIFNRKQLGLFKLIIKIALIIYFTNYYLGVLEMNIDKLLPYRFFWE